MSRKFIQITFSILLLAGMMFAFAVKDGVLASASPDEPNGKIEGMLLDKFNTDGSADFIVTFTEKADLSAAYTMDWDSRGQYVYDKLTEAAKTIQAPAIAALGNFGLKYQSFFAANTLYVWGGNLEAANAVAALPGTESVRATRVYHVDPLIETANPLFSAKWAGDLLANNAETTAGTQGELAWGIVDTQADQFWNNYGMRGEGMVVASIDTGVDWTHEVLQPNYKCAADPSSPTCWLDPAPADCTGQDGGPCDSWSPIYHGTHTTGTMVGDDAPELPYSVGMAPNAQWIACTGCPYGSCPDYDLFACVDWSLAPGGNPDARPNVVNNSWGGGGGSDWFLGAVNSWRAAGIFPAFAAGNNYSCNSLGSPGDYQESFGSAAHRSDRIIADFSSKGPSYFGDDPYTKPNLSAPGQDVWSAMPGDGYQYMSGTSMASPHTAGAVALLWSCNPALVGDIDQTFQILQDSADVPPPGDCGAPADGEGNYTYGYGYLNINTAGSEWCGDIGTVEGYVDALGSGAPIMDVQVHGDNQGGPGSFTVLTDEMGNYHAQALVGTYDVTASKYGWIPGSAVVTIVIDQTTVQNFSLAQAPMSTVDGHVTDALTGWPLYARIDIDGYPDSPVWTDPETGYYNMSLADGIAYTFHVNAWSGGYIQEDRSLPVLSGPRTEDFALNVEVAACNAPGYQPATSYLEDFEANNGGFTIDPASVNTTWAWGVPTSGPGSAHSGVNVWATNLSGNYLDYSDDYLVSPNIDLSSLAGGFKLDWWQWLQTESCCDPAYVQVSNDGGANWNTVYQAQGSMDLSWTEHSVMLDSSYAVNNFRVRFYLHTDLSVTYPGWYIDDIAVLGECLPQDGGLVVGNVYDMNTNLPLPDSVVTADTGASVTVVDTPDDPNVDDGFYLLFAKNIIVDTLVPAPTRMVVPEPVVTNPGITTTSPKPEVLGKPEALAHPEDVLWDQPLSVVNQNAYIDQQFSDFTTFSSYLADDFINDDPWMISTIFVPGNGWNGFSTLFNATAMHWEIYADSGGIPAGNPEAGSALWSLSLPPTDPQVVISTGTPGGYPSNTTLNLATPINLPPGHYWLVFYPTMSFGSYGQFGRQPADTANGYFGQYINPGGGFGYGTVWQSWLVIGATQQDIAFRLEGSIVVGTSHELTATHTNYSPDTETVDVPQWGVVSQDFYLGTGDLSFTPPSIEVTLDMGANTTVNGTLTNDGSGAAYFEFMEQDRGFVPTGYIEYLPIPEMVGTEGAVHNGPLDTTITRQPYIFHGNAPQAANIIVYCDDDQHSPTYVELALQAAGLTYTFYGNPGDPGPLDQFTNEVNTLTYDLVILAQDSWVYNDAREYTAVQNHIANGGSAIVYSWGIGYGPTQSGHGLWAAMGAQYQSWINSPANLYWWEDSHPIFNNVPEFTQLNNLGYLAYGAKMSLLGDPSTGLGGFTTDPAANEAGIILREDLKTLYRGLTDNLNSADQDSDGTPDAEEWWTNAVGFILNPNIDIIWLTENPTSGTLDPDGGSVTADVTFDANVVTQPGTYKGTLNVKSNDPFNSLIGVPVTMTVTAPDSYGTLEGTVTGLGYCDANPSLLEGTTVVITSTSGVSWTLETDENGHYFIWLDSEDNPYTIEVTYPEYLGQTTTANIIPGGDVVVDFNLRWMEPCVTAEPPRLEVVLDLGDTQTVQLTLTDNGVVSSTFEISDLDRGYLPPQVLNVGAVWNGVYSDDAAAFTMVASQPKIVGGTVLLIQDYLSWGYPAIETILTGNGIPYDLINSSQIGSTDFSAYDMIIVPTVQGSAFNTLYNDNLAKFEDFIDGGGKMILEFAEQSSDTPYKMLPFGGTNNFGGSDYNYIVVPEHPIFAGVPNPYYGSWANHNYLTDLLPDDQVLVTAGSTPGGNTVMIERSHGAGLLVAGGQTFEYGWGAGQDSGLILANMIPYYYSLELASDAQWLTEDPLSGTIAPDGGTTVINVTFDASNPITVPITGTYVADIMIKTDDPVTPKIIVPAIMNVFPPDFGHVEGTVMSLGYCDQNPEPIPGVMVQIGEFTLTTDENGHYSKWLEEGTYEVTVTADGHIGATATVVVVGRQTTVQDFNLRLEQPCVSTDPTSYEVWLITDTQVTQPLALINAGAADTPFQITELPGAPGLERGGALSHQVPVVTLPDGFPQTYSEYIASGLPAPTLQPVAPTISAVAPENLSFYYDRGTFDADYPGLPVEGLENGSMPYGSVDSVPHPLDQYSSNAYFDPGDILPGIQFWASVTHLGDEIAVFGEQFMSNPTKTAGPNYFVDSYIIMFDPPVAAAGMDLQELMSATQCQVDVYDTNGYLGSDISNCDATGVFWGVASDENPITEIVVTSLGLGGEVVDNIAFGGEISVDIPWLSEDPIEGTVVADNSTEVSVTIVVTPEMPLGDYFAQLNVKTEDPEKGKIKVPVTLHVVPEYLAPVVTFDSNTPVMLGDTMLFTNTTTDLGIPPVKVFEWNFGDGTVEDYGLTDPVTHVYTAARLYDVTVTACSVPDKCGTATVTVEVRKAPDASFTSNSPVVLGSPVVFTNTTVDGFPDDTTYAWDFGDGGTSTDADPTHTYAARGIYSVTLTACNSVPLCDTFVAEVEVTGTAPVAAFTSNSPVTLGNPMVFTNTTVAGEPAETTYEWDFGDDAGTSTDVNPTYTYDEVGTYTVTLTACNLVGCTTFSADVVVNPVVIEQRNIFLPLVNSH